MKYKHIAIEGNIGSGKTTLAKMLASDYNMKLILEEFADNPFLPSFYNNLQNNVLPLELFFLAERYYQLKKNQEKDLFQSSLISDYFFIKSKLFAQNNLKDDELQLFNRLFDIFFNIKKNNKKFTRYNCSCSWTLETNLFFFFAIFGGLVFNSINVSSVS